MTARKIIRVVSCNFERNGRSDYDTWLTMYQRLAALRPAVLCRQENPGHARTGAGRLLFNESQRILGLAGELGPGLGTDALYYDQEVFEQLTVWETACPAWPLPPVAMTLRLRGTEDVDLVAACTRLSYNSPTCGRSRRATSPASPTASSPARPAPAPPTASCPSWRSARTATATSIPRGSSPARLPSPNSPTSRTPSTGHTAATKPPRAYG
ncbi:hypothetical protein [Streptomyces scabiei]|uniref:hypothetical protein n=1 Tax=Streptomyces scabiei TaxID=1930 RepID=UPI001FF205E8|nr:hypothetical protein [Streptomyces sp. LBUM 1482]